MTIKIIRVTNGDIDIDYTISDKNYPVMGSITIKNLGEIIYDFDNEDWIWEYLYNWVTGNHEVLKPELEPYKFLLKKLFNEIRIEEKDPVSKALKWVDNRSTTMLELFFDDKLVSNYAKKQVLKYIKDLTYLYNELETTTRQLYRKRT